jgi:hypothetical protein
MTERQKDAAVVLALGVFAFSLFWDARIGIPRADHLYFLKEHDRLPGAWDFFWNAVSYNRANSRVMLVGTGDHFLFRPLFGATVAAVELLGRGSLLVAGLAGIAFHWIACATLYVVGRGWAGRGLAAAGAFLMTAELAGMDAVVWTHIDPYLLALALLALGISANERPARAALLLLLSAWIQEAALVALVVLGVAAGRRGLAFWVALAVYAATDVVDLLVHPWGSVAHAFTERRSGYFPAGAFLDAVRVAGLAVIGRIAPGAVELSFLDAPWDRALWPVASVADAWTLPLGALAWAAIGVVGFVAMRAEGTRRAQGLALAAAWITVPISLVALRFSVRSILYLGISTYYFYVLDYVAILLALWLAAGRRRSPATTALAWAVCVGMALPAAAKIHRLLGERATFVRGVRDASAAIARGIGADECYGGSLDEMITPLQPPMAQLVLVRGKACSGDERRPVYLRARDGYELVALSEPIAGATEVVTQLAVQDGAGFSVQTVAGEDIAVRYHRGTWSIGDAGMWHVPADGTSTVGFRQIAEQWYAVVDDRVLARVPPVDPSSTAGTPVAREIVAERPLVRD